VLEVATLRPIGLEALLRWRHPRRGVLLPSEFLSVAEDSRQIVQIGRFAFEQALADLALVRANVPSAQQLWVAVNISARQLETGTVELEFARALEASQVDPDLVHLELTESAFIDPDGAAFDVLSGLTGLGLHLGVDDFGTGYSSLTYLQRLPIEMMKVDRSFVAGLGTDHGDTAIVEAIVQLAHALGIVVVAEGVEEPAQLDRLRALACEYAQGHLWSYSLDLEAVCEWLRDEYGRQLRVVPVAAGGVVDANAPATS
jgi:diguanylate cyclase